MVQPGRKNSVHKTNARKGTPHNTGPLFEGGRKATVFDWEEATARERAHKLRSSQETSRSRTVRITKRKKKIVSTLLSEIDFATKHGIHKISFNKALRGLRKLYKVRAKNRLTKDKIIINSEIVATFIRRLKDKENPNLTEANTIAFSNWACGRDPTKLKSIR